ncbi:hypothetical protein LTR05_003538 [Lithohypha guttulata]|uniref:RBR-type E3 ubiquitin transferase n=1 Tax=Lithohypha guttulata TaxID=1690604 RepID=A0AAN7YB63_9EURO|nr:hypothetical protein LTR05_003538 [Lithohypha guttulata]
MDHTPLHDDPEDNSNNQQSTNIEAADPESIISLLENLTLTDHEHLEDIHDSSETNSDAPQETTEQERADFELAMLLQAQEDRGFEEHDQDLPPEERECSCGEVYTCLKDIAVLNCGCVRCPDCLNQNVLVGLESKASFPPKCHGPIDIEDISHFIEPLTLARWSEVKTEYTDVAPVYCAIQACAIQACSQYLSKNTFVEEGKWALCYKCNAKTCPACLHLQTEHEKGVYPERLAKLDRELMDKEGWKECPQCKNMIEKSDGCDHMICECGQEFCYQCGRSYTGGLPCNCHGNNEWVEEDPEDNDPFMQQRLMDEIANMGRRRVRRPRRDESDDDEEDSDIDSGDEASDDNEEEVDSDNEEESDDDSDEDSGDDEDGEPTDEEEGSNPGRPDTPPW